ncbi:MAG: carboxypeptidase regulatory-like domain-containing protein [Acidobacteria bacterium]|nr:carboxypeptidase regulatory-like domain-containing protein [Acidobacteriota bacterium]
MPDASVRLTALKTGHTKETKSDQDGSFRAEIVHGWFAGRFQLIVSKQGYSTYQQEVRPKTSSNFNVILTPVSK